MGLMQSKLPSQSDLLFNRERQSLPLLVKDAPEGKAQTRPLQSRMLAAKSASWGLLEQMEGGLYNN
jgi:hypothetical protein